MKSIIISGMPAVGKTTVAKIVAQELKIRIMGGGEILKDVAREHGYKPEGIDWWDTQAGLAFLKERLKNPGFDVEVDRRLQARVGYGNVVITSYPLPWITKEPAFKVWLDAKFIKRAARMVVRDKIAIKDCLRVTKERDKENERLYSRLYGIRFGKDKKPFDLIIDTNEKKPEIVAAEIVEKMKELSL